MAIYPEKAAIFIGIPKTASTSIEQYLSHYIEPLRGIYRGVLLNTGHATIVEHQSVGLWFPDYFSFSFVRNPWDRLVSAFFFLDAGGCTPKDKALRNKYIAQYSGDFEHFVTEFITSPYRDSIIHLRPQYQFIIQNEQVAIDFLGRYERLSDDFALVCDRMRIPQRRLPHTIVSNHESYVDYYNDNTRRIVKKAYARDIELFGYCFS